MNGKLGEKATQKKILEESGIVDSGVIVVVRGKATQHRACRTQPVTNTKWAPRVVLVRLSE